MLAADWLLFSPKPLISERSSAFPYLRLANVERYGAQIGVADFEIQAQGACGPWTRPNRAGESDAKLAS